MFLTATLLPLSVTPLRADPAPKNRVTQEGLNVLKQTYHFEPKATPVPVVVKPAAGDAIMMSKVTVRGKKMPEFSEDEIFTDKGLSEMFLKRYPGQSVKGQAATTKEFVQAPNYAAMSHRADVRLAQKQGFDDLAETLQRTGDVAAAKKLQRDIYDVFIRNSTDQEKAMEKSANGGR